MSIVPQQDILGKRTLLANILYELDDKKLGAATAAIMSVVIARKPCPTVAYAMTLAHALDGPGYDQALAVITKILREGR